MRIRRNAARSRAAAAALTVVLAACSAGEPDQVEASQATPEPTVEAPSETDEPTEPEATESEPDPEPTIGEDDPLYAPLPDLEPDPDNDVPDDIEQLILDAFADAYNTEFATYTTGLIDEEQLRSTHAMTAYDDVVYAHEEMSANNVLEWSGDSSVDSVFIRDFAGGSAVIRECFTIGPATGDYDAETGELVVAAEEGEYARDWLIELVGLEGEEHPRYRVVEAARTTDTAGCEEA